MIKKAFLSTIGLALASQVHAQSYQFEGAGIYSQNKADDDLTNTKGDAVSLNGSYYFLQVITENHPLQEAAFLGKNSSVSLSYHKTKSEGRYSFDGGFYSIKSEAEEKGSLSLIAADTYLLNGLIYIGAVALHSETESLETDRYTSATYPSLNSTETTKEKDALDEWRINLGIAPARGLLLWSEFEKDVHVNKSWNLNAKYVMEFNGSALNIEGGIGKNSFAFLSTPWALYNNSTKINFSGIVDDDIDFSSAYLIGDYYFNRTLSFGLGASHYSGDMSDRDNSYLIHGQKFFSDKFSVNAEYVREEFQNTYTIGATIRF